MKKIINWIKKNIVISGLILSITIGGTILSFNLDPVKKTITFNVVKNKDDDRIDIDDKNDDKDDEVVDRDVFSKS